MRLVPVEKGNQRLEPTAATVGKCYCEKKSISSLCLPCSSLPLLPPTLRMAQGGSCNDTCSL